MLNDFTEHYNKEYQKVKLEIPPVMRMFKKYEHRVQYYYQMFGVEFFVAFGIGMLTSAGAMVFYHHKEDDIRRTLDKIKKDI
ncbi:MAG: hypothetical protein ACR2IS_19710 [Nitrososphaeraceae archaeon]